VLASQADSFHYTGASEEVNVPTWQIRIQRLLEQNRNGRTRTVGSYQVYHDGVPVADYELDGELLRLSGTTAESRGPGQNDHEATDEDPSRILPGHYPLKTSDGPAYVTHGYREDDLIENGMPGLELFETEARVDILLHPGKQDFLSSIGCINLCTSLPDENEDIDYPGSRRRVIALIRDMQNFIGEPFPEGDDDPIPDAWCIVAGEP
jgi:hypothetical protein